MTGGRIKYRIPKLPESSYMTVILSTPTTSLLLKYLPYAHYFPILVDEKMVGHCYLLILSLLVEYL